MFSQMATTLYGTAVSYMTWPSTFITILLILNLKNLPLMWHFRFLRALLTHLLFNPSQGQLTPQCLFLPVITSTRAPFTECDYNIHKSNSTYSTDLDMSRGRLGLLLFQKRLSVFPSRNATMVILSGSSIVFKREIKPYQPYEIWTRILSWDKKWLYLVSHFVEKGRYEPSSYYLQPDKAGSHSMGEATQSSSQTTKDERLKHVFASAISRYVFKRGRITVPPSKMLEDCGLLPLESDQDNTTGTSDRQEKIWPPTTERHNASVGCTSGADIGMGSAAGSGIRRESSKNGENKAEGRAEIECKRLDNLLAAQLLAGWDAVHDQFEGDTQPALGKYADMLWA